MTVGCENSYEMSEATLSAPEAGERREPGASLNGKGLAQDILAMWKGTCRVSSVEDLSAQCTTILGYASREAESRSTSMRSPHFEEDLREDAIVAVVLASPRYHPQKGSFMAWALQVVRWEMIDSVSRLRLYLSRAQWKNWRVMQPAYDDLSKSLGRNPCAEEVYDHLQGLPELPALSLVQVQNTFSALQSAKPESLDAALASEAEGGPPHKDWEPQDPMTPDREAMRREFLELLDEGLQGLPKDQAEAFELVWIQCRTQERAALELGVSQSQVSKLVAKATLRLSQHLARHDYSPDPSD
jgi:RNA polymerase sigma factor (sigma-70 family)